ncbi:hypothetical protein [Ekhidna sp.]|uniref:hypothetical protein n=1 Tax=Ekhidna sp. TaxID=2608089 RepID=UPI003BA9AE57
MNAQMTTSYDSYETSPLQLVKSDLKYFNVQYLRTLNLTQQLDGVLQMMLGLNITSYWLTLNLK